MPELESILERLIQNHVEFVVVGGFAAVAHGSPYLTRDVDVCCRFTPDNLLALQAAVSDLHPVHRMTPKKRPLELTKDNCRGLKNLYLDTEYGQLDCLGEIRGVGGFDEVLKNSISVKLPFGSCRILHLEALIRAKKAMGREHDLAAVRALEQIQRNPRNTRNGTK